MIVYAMYVKSTSAAEHAVDTWTMTSLFVSILTNLMSVSAGNENVRHKRVLPSMWERITLAAVGPAKPWWAPAWRGLSEIGLAAMFFSSTPMLNVIIWDGARVSGHRLSWQNGCCHVLSRVVTKTQLEVGMVGLPENLGLWQAHEQHGLVSVKIIFLKLSNIL